MPLTASYHSRPRFAVSAAALMLMGGCSERSAATLEATATWADPSSHKSDSVFVNGIHLNYLDWGGQGAPLILLHGMGDNAHIFDDLVPALGSGFRVVAYSRRGHGHSGKAGPYDTATLVDDLRQFLDSLGLTTVSLAAWSHSGNEMSMMAEAYPERVAKIVYLESAYDWGDPALGPIFQNFPMPFNPSGESLSSFDAFRAWQLHNVFPGIAQPQRLEAFFRDQVDVSPDGRVQLMATDSLQTAMFQAGYRRSYARIKAPALVIAAETYLDVAHGDSTQRARNLAWERSYMGPYRQLSIERASRELPHMREVVTVPGAHPDFVILSRDRVAEAMRRFLLN